MRLEWVSSFIKIAPSPDSSSDRSDIHNPLLQNTLAERIPPPIAIQLQSRPGVSFVFVSGHSLQAHDRAYVIVATFPWHLHPTPAAGCTCLQTPRTRDQFGSIRIQLLIVSCSICALSTASSTIFWLHIVLVFHLGTLCEAIPHATKDALSSWLLVSE